MESGSGGSYSDYSNGKEWDGNGGKGGPSSNCPDNIIFELEDVGRCPYYKSNNDVPTVDSSIKLKDKLYNNRLAIEDKNHTVIGLVPIAHNYLHECIKAQFKYYGIVIDSSNTTTPYVEVEINKK